MAIITHQFVIYHIVNLEDSKTYIGCSKEHSKRWREHRKKLLEDRHENRYLQRAWNKYGESQFEFRIHLTCETEEEMFQTEISLIESSKNLYNLAAGGKGGNTTKNWTVEEKDELKARISKQFKEEFAIGIRKPSMKKFSELSEDDANNKRRVWSECKTGKLNGRFRYSQPIEQLTKDGKSVNIWSDISEIRSDSNFTAKYVLHCCNSRPNYESHKGFKWRFAKCEG